MTELVTSHGCKVKRLPKDYVPGYAAVLMRVDVKERLWRFRQAAGLLHESMVERCLVTAAMEMVLGDPSLHGRWFDRFREAVQTDVEVTMRGARVSPPD